MAQSTTVPEKDKPIEERWQDYGIALLTFIISIFVWMLIGSMALWAFQNKSTEISLPSDLNKLPYVNSGGSSKNGDNGIFDLPLFSYKAPVGFPYSSKEKEDTVWDGFGNWFSRTEIGAWGYARRAILEIGKMIALSFSLLSKIPDIPGIKVNYYNIAELVAIFVLPIIALFSYVSIQPAVSGITTLVSSFYNNSWIWGLIGLWLPVWILTIFNAALQHFYLAGWLFWIPLFSGGFGFMRKVAVRNKMTLLLFLCLAAIIISIGYLPGEITVGMALGLALILVWRYFFGPITSQAISKLGKSKSSTGRDKSGGERSRHNTNNDVNSNNSNSRNNNNSKSSNSKSSNSTSRTFSFDNIPSNELTQAMEKIKMKN